MKFSSRINSGTVADADGGAVQDAEADAAADDHVTTDFEAGIEQPKPGQAKKASSVQVPAVERAEAGMNPVLR